MDVIKSPSAFDASEKTSIFLAGTIDNGNSTDWQKDVEHALKDQDVLVFNPRRDEWDASWEQSISNPIFKQQVEWELEALESSTVIFLYFTAESKSPISLLELGLHAASNKLIIVCPDGFWRLGNIEVVAQRYKIPLYKNLDSGIAALKKTLQAMQ